MQKDQIPRRCWCDNTNNGKKDPKIRRYKNIGLSSFIAIL